MIIAGLVLAGLAAALHVYIWFLESMAWHSPAARAVFGHRREDVEVTRMLAFNQGFYNLFLAILVALGTILYATGNTTVGLTLVLAGAGSMLAAAVVLLGASAKHRGAALKQGALPALAVAALVIGLLR